MTEAQTTTDTAAIATGVVSYLAVAAREESSQPLTLEGRILLVEDGIDNQHILSLYLRRAGAEVVIAANGRVAIERATAEPLDLILMDMQMPELDGYAATRELRLRGCLLPIIALTAHCGAEDRAKCLAAGCTGYVTKPIERNTLLTCVAGYLEGRRSGNTLSPAAPIAPEHLPSGEALRSCYADDPTMHEAIAEFVAMLPRRVALMRKLIGERQLPELRRVVHQLKGAGGGYGFDKITRLATQADCTLKQDSPLETIERVVEPLIALIRSVEDYQLSRELIHG